MPKPQLKKDFWEELDGLLAPTVPPPDSFTVLEFAERKSRSPERSYVILHKLVQEGKLTKTVVLVNGKITNYYSIPTK